VLTEVKEEYLRKHRLARTGPYLDPGQVQSVFPVLCLQYTVCASENCLGPLCFTVDCTRYGTCSYQDITAVASIDFGTCPNLPSDLSLTLYNPEAQFNWTTGILDPTTGCQVRGPQGQFILNQTTCTWSAPRFIHPSYTNVGGGTFTFPTLRLPIQVRVDENTLSYTGVPYPEVLQHPYSTAVVDCSNSPTCSLPIGALASVWEVQSLRGLPDPNGNGLFSIKFGDNSQNVIRQIPSTSLIAPGWNNICVLSDNRPWYVALWGTWSSEGPYLPYDDCSKPHGNTVLSVCNTNVTVPVYSK